MTQTRATIIAKGEVQRVGYRDAVEKIARKLNIKGFVENLKPYDVKIVCEGDEETVKKFIEQIRIEDDPLIRVSEVSVQFKEPTGEFEYFEIKRGSREEEDAERWDAAAGYLKTLIKSMGIMHGKQDKTIEIMKGVGEDTKYIPGIKGDTNKMLEKQDLMLEKQDSMLEKQDKTIEILEDVREDTGEITNALAFLKEIYRETSELRDKYGVLSRDVEAIKVKLNVG